jgi:hypothetical protein
VTTGEKRDDHGLVALDLNTAPARRVPVPGALAGKIGLKDDFDAPLPDDIQRAFDVPVPEVAAARCRRSCRC